MNYDQQYLNEYLGEPGVLADGLKKMPTTQGAVQPSLGQPALDPRQMDIPASNSAPPTGSTSTTTTNTNTNSTNTTGAAPLTNKQLYLLNMNNNPHVMSDPAIQETLSPYFQPFGVDVAHLPMTNPPIFQSALPVYDEPVPRRRISISNGQISQLGEDLETVENLYNTQPPPLPRYHEPQQNRQAQSQQYSEPAQPQWHGEQPPQFAQPFFPQQQQQQQQQPLVKQEPLAADAPLDGLPRQAFSAAAPVGVTPGGSAGPAGGGAVGSVGSVGATNALPQYALGPQHVQVLPQQPQPQQPQPQQHQQRHPLGQPPQRMEDERTSGDSQSQQSQPQPGTSAWKRARLLERNRIAASKCRQRKKVAQMQLQVDYNRVAKDNAVLRRKIVYYEKLISKFKKFMESHFNICHKSSNSVNDEDKNALKMIQEMLMIDEDVHEVNDNGKIVKLSVKEPSPEDDLLSPTAQPLSDIDDRSENSAA